MTTERQKTGKGSTALQPTREMEELGRHFKDIFRRLFLPGTPAKVVIEEEQTTGKK